MTNFFSLDLPDSVVCATALEELRDVASPMIVNHSLRCFFLGRAYAQKRDLPFDAEGLFLAAAYHDLGLCPAHRNRKEPFTRVGSRALDAHAAEHGIDEARRRTLVDAIEYHMWPVPRWSKSHEAGLMQLSAWMDVMYWRRWSLAKEAKAIEARLPREGLTLGFMPCLLATIGSPASVLGLAAPGLYR
ncbi:MAG: HD domain-containing protein [Deltaproteobacteria bacterium]|nr:HD domain-containing protein [Deltaproteobacteria bacterium]MCB9488366.1 HD domain-containing protein [Deltaproteobacteria bacterium]